MRMVDRLRSDRGFTMVEMLAVFAVSAILFGIAASAFTNYQVKTTHRAARTEVVSVLRNTAERALSEGRTYCVYFNGDTWATYRYACSGSTSVLVEPARGFEASQEHLAASLTTPTFPAPSVQATSCPAANACAYFYPRGISSSGTVTVSRSGLPNLAVTLEGLTSRARAS